jgi:NADH-quinone oxidoreductase subunit K
MLTRSRKTKMDTITPHHFLVLSFLLFGVGFLGVVLRRNLLLVLMSLELMLNGVNVALVSFSRTSLNLDGSLFVFFIMTVAATEVAVGLALLVALYKKRQSVFSEDISLLKN